MESPAIITFASLLFAAVLFGGLGRIFERRRPRYRRLTKEEDHD